jgi:hypothetical protein
MAASARTEANMRLLEDTGLVDYSLLPPSTSPATRLTAIGGYTVPVTLLLFLAAVLVGAAMLRGLAPRRESAGPDSTAGNSLFGRAGSVQPAIVPAKQWAERAPGRSPVETPTVPAPREVADRRPPKLGKSRGVRGW